jgi:hypothetical protein
VKVELSSIVHKRFTTVLSIVLALLGAPCLAWGPDGHRIIGDIAWSYLTDHAKAQVKDLLGELSLADACNWADEIRKDSTYDWAKPLHYVNVPRDAATVSMQRDCESGQCVIGAIKKYSDVLRSTDATRQQRVEALKFLAHFVGDIHQPLHVSYADDRGGNQVKVTWFGQPDWNLHRVWDDGLIKHWLGSDGQARVQELRKAITDQRVKRWRASLDPADWANESLTITRRLYRELPANRQLDEMYYKRNVSRFEERLAAAGIRLAALLNDIFPETPATKSAE